MKDTPCSGKFTPCAEKFLYARNCLVHVRKLYSAYMDFDLLCKKPKKEADLHIEIAKLVRLRCDFR